MNDSIFCTIVISFSHVIETPKLRESFTFRSDNSIFFLWEDSYEQAGAVTRFKTAPLARRRAEGAPQVSQNTIIITQHNMLHEQPFTSTQITALPFPKHKISLNYVLTSLLFVNIISYRQHQFRLPQTLCFFVQDSYNL